MVQVIHFIRYNIGLPCGNNVSHKKYHHTKISKLKYIK